MMQKFKATQPQEDNSSEPEDDKSIDTFRLTNQFDHVEEVQIN